MSRLRCKEIPIDICHEPKISDQQLDILRNMIKCLCKCGDAEDNIGGGTGGEEPTTPIINTEWVVNNITDGSSCGKFLIQSSRTKDNIKVFSDIEVIPTVQQVSDEIIAGNYGTEVNNAVLAIDPDATDWVLDPANNSITYTAPSDPSLTSEYSYRYIKGYPNCQDFSSVNREAVADYAARCYGQYYFGDANLGYTSISESSSSNIVAVYVNGSPYNIYRSDNPNYDPAVPANEQKSIPIYTVASQVISDAEACDTSSKNRLFNIVTSLVYSGFYNDLFENNIL